MSATQRIVVVGGGLTGLLAANHLADAGGRATVVEASGTMGGQVQSCPFAGHVVDMGAEAIHPAAPGVTELLRRAGVEDDVVQARAGVTLVATARGLRALPQGDGPEWTVAPLAGRDLAHPVDGGDASSGRRALDPVHEPRRGRPRRFVPVAALRVPGDRAAGRPVAWKPPCGGRAAAEPGRRDTRPRPTSAGAPLAGHGATRRRSDFPAQLRHHQGWSPQDHRRARGRTTAAPHYRRVALQGNTAPRRTGSSTPVGALFEELSAGSEELFAGSLAERHSRRPPLDVNAGKGFVFVDHVGVVYPSGFLPVPVGSVRHRSLVDIYRDAPLLRQLRDPDRLGGRCGRCEFRTVCGGSRSRAYATTGDPLAEDPICAHLPDGTFTVGELGSTVPPGA